MRTQKANDGISKLLTDALSDWLLGGMWTDATASIHDRSNQMKCLTVHQPWAHAIVTGMKTIENRTWPTNYRGPLLIHAGKSRERMRETVYPDGSRVPSASSLVFGAILGKCTLIDCVKYEKVKGDVWSEPGWCWVLKDAEEFEKPIPYKGEMGLFDVPESVLCEVKKEPMLFIL